MTAAGLSIVQRFWPKVDRREPHECWPWTASTNPHGYGQIKVRDKLQRAHRVAYWLTHGVWPPVVRHTCDNPPCCNPAHLLPGTQSENRQDMYDRGRASGGRTSRRGADHPMAKLTQDDVAEIIRRRATGETYRSLGAAFGIAASQAYRIVVGQRWAA